MGGAIRVPPQRTRARLGSNNNSGGDHDDVLARRPRDHDGRTDCRGQPGFAQELKYKPISVKTPDGLTISAQEWGNPTGPEILLIHGFSQSHLSWMRQVDSDLAKEFRIVTYDLRGHGNSDKPLDKAPLSRQQGMGRRGAGGDGCGGPEAAGAGRLVLCRPGDLRLRHDPRRRQARRHQLRRCQHQVHPSSSATI